VAGKAEVLMDLLGLQESDRIYVSHALTSTQKYETSMITMIVIGAQLPKKNRIGALLSKYSISHGNQQVDSQKRPVAKVKFDLAGEMEARPP
jgi:hypothetical protein